MLGFDFLHPVCAGPSKLVKAAVCSFIFASLTLAVPAIAKPLQAQNGDVLVAGGIGANAASTGSAELYRVSDGTFHPARPMRHPRAGHQAQTVAPNSEKDSAGNVTVAGGFRGSVKKTGQAIMFRIDPLNSVERYYPAKGSFATNKSGGMDTGRALAASVVFPAPFDYAPFVSGHVLIAGGICNAADLGECVGGNILHPDGDVTSSGGLNTQRVAYTMTMLGNGTVLAAGGIGDLAGDTLNSAEIFDPENQEQFTALSSPMNVARAGHTATLLNDGTVLIAGGLTGSGGNLNSTDTAEVYDPGARTFTAVGPMIQPRAGHTATLLGDGTVLIAGGFDGSGSFTLKGKSRKVTAAWKGSGAILQTAEIYDPATQAFTCVGGAITGGGCAPSMTATRVAHSATMLSSGSVLIAGGIGGSQRSVPKPLHSAELYRGGSFTATGSMKTARALHTASVISR